MLLRFALAFEPWLVIIIGPPIIAIWIERTRREMSNV